MRKLKKQRVANMQRETITINNSSIWSLQGKTFDTKDIISVVVPDNLLLLGA